MPLRLYSAVIIGLLLAAWQPAHAKDPIVEELRFGVLAHNISVGINPGNENQEDGENIQGEIVFGSPPLLDRRWTGRPRPYIVGSVNTAGDTSFGGFGLLWNFDFGRGKKWSVEPGLGYIVHSGAIDLPFPIGDPQNTEFDENNILFGSRDLFRTTLALNRDLGQRWGMQIIYEHLSHGQILGQGRNQGNDSIGARVYFRFGVEK
ncbi:MAG: acyloxyacyl hydrolase [Pseudomonadota bacterium]